MTTRDDSLPVRVPIDSMERMASVVRALGEIDLDNLAGEVQDASGHSIWWGVLQAEADAEVERAKLRLKTIEAESAREYRIARLRNEEKITEAMVVEHLVLDPNVREAKERVIEMERRASILRATSMAVNQKARTLQNLTFLVGQEYGARQNPLRERMREEIRQQPRKREPV